VTVKGNAFEEIEKTNKPFFCAGDPGHWEAILAGEEIRTSSASPDVAIEIDRYYQLSEEAEE
jgi:hypothetical protein